MKRLLAALTIAAAGNAIGPAAAAPIALERQLAPKAALVDARFEAAAEAGAIPVDHAEWTRFLSAYVVVSPDGVNRVRYGAVTKEDRAALDAYIGTLEKTDVPALARKEQIAFWFNLYNAATVRLILQNPAVASIRDIKKPWDTSVATVMGRALTLNEIEHGIVRPIARDPRIHYAVNCASIGCPNLRPEAYAGDSLDAQLDAAARAYINHPRGVEVADGKVRLSKIFGWYRDDFGKDDAALFDHLRQYADPALAQKLKGVKKASSYDYDWALNAAP